MALLAMREFEALRRRKVSRSSGVLGLSKASLLADVAPRPARCRNQTRDPTSLFSGRHEYQVRVGGFALKPATFHDLPATREAMEQAFGQRFGRLFLPNTSLGSYGTVHFFGEGKAVTGGEVRRALKKPGADAPPILLVARDFTLEARELAASTLCDVLSIREFGWTDAAYISARNNLYRR